MAEVTAPVESLTVDQAASTWLLNLEYRKRKPAKPATLKTFASVVRVHITPFLGGRTVESVGNVVLREFVAHLAERNLAPKTINFVLGVVKSVITSCVNPDTGEALFHPRFNSEFIDAPIVENQNQPIVNTQELEAALNAATSFDRAMLALLAGSGIRIGEMLAVRIGTSEVSSCWNVGAAALDIKSAVFGGQEQSPKTKNSFRVVELAEPLNKLLQDFAGSRTDGFLFGNGRQTSLSVIRDHLDKYLPSRGFHSLRRYRARHLRSSNVLDEITKYWLGHSNKGDITSVYSQVWSDPSRRRAEANRVGLGFELPQRDRESND